MRYILFFQMVIILTTNYTVAQSVPFKTIHSSVNNYTFNIPSSFAPKQAIGEHIEFKYVDANGSSIMTIVKQAPLDMSESIFDGFMTYSDEEVVNAKEDQGLSNVTILQRGIKNINNRKTYFEYYSYSSGGTLLYNYSISQFKPGKLIVLQCVCPLTDKDRYLPYFYRVTNSLKF